jgi:aryl-alcohol dehydrogenase-like predicted oxidoreductase
MHGHPGRHQDWLRPPGPATVGVALDSRPEHIREVTDNSLRYLDTDYIDVLF